MRSCLILGLIWLIVRTVFYITLSCYLLSKGLVGWGIVVLLAQAVDLVIGIVEEGFYAKAP